MLTSIDLSSTWHITQSTVISLHSLDNFSLKKKKFSAKSLTSCTFKREVTIKQDKTSSCNNHARISWVYSHSVSAVRAKSDNTSIDTAERLTLLQRLSVCQEIKAVTENKHRMHNNRNNRNKTNCRHSGWHFTPEYLLGIHRRLWLLGKKVKKLKTNWKGVKEIEWLTYFLRLCGSTVWLLLIYGIKKKKKLFCRDVCAEVWALDRRVFMAAFHGKPPGRQHRVKGQCFNATLLFQWIIHMLPLIWRETMLIFNQLHTLHNVPCTQNWSIIGRPPPPAECRSGIEILWPCSRTSLFE